MNKTATVGAERPRLLVVDDEPDVLEALQDLVETRIGGIDVECFSSSRKALERLSSEPAVDAAVVDFRMPDVDGVKFMAALSQRQPMARSIMYTAYGDFELVTRSVNEGRAARFFRKPMSPEQLLEAIEECAWEAFLERVSDGDPAKAEAWVRDHLTV